MNLIRSSLLVAGMALVVVGTPLTAPAAEDGDLELARRLENVFAKVAQNASASVVVINTKQKIATNAPEGDEDGEENPFEGTPFEKFFHRGMPFDHPRETDAQGSGVIIRADGYILTNNHVVDQAEEIKVRLKDGREFPAKVVGVDDRTDVAVIRVEAKDLPAATLANSEKVRVGQWAIAIGTPFQLDYSFTVGVVSATGRSAVWSRGGSAYEDYIQTDASINPGNSGGPLCDIEGHVIGINTLIRGLNRGIGFAIPINMAMDVAAQLIDKGRIVRPWIGIEIEALADNKELAEAMKDVKDGVVVRAIYPKTPAAESDLKPADIIVAVDNVAVKNPRELQKQILRKSVGQKVSLKVYRDGKPITVALKTGELPESPQLASNLTPKGDSKSAYGLTVQTLTKEIAQRFNLANARGVIVTDVESGSPADQQRLQRGDVITEVNRAPVTTAAEFEAAVKKADANKGALIYYTREGSAAFVVLKETD